MTEAQNHLKQKCCDEGLPTKDQSLFDFSMVFLSHFPAFPSIISSG